uniref:Cnidarian restricted protein n=1 Tax=Clytia hemisphaerica TaxID=252671 RepID=A0A7M6DL03_9CNID
MVRISFLVISFLFTAKIDGFQIQDFGMLACPHKQNVTIIVDWINQSFLDELLLRLERLTRNEDCFNVNVYLPSDGFVIQWRPNFNINHFERNFNGYTMNIPQNDLENFLKRLYNEKVIGNKTVKQTLVYLDAVQPRKDIEETFSLMQRLQNDRLWNIIFHCDYQQALLYSYVRNEIGYTKNDRLWNLFFPSDYLNDFPNWLPAHRLSFSFRTFLPEKSNTILKNLLDVIKEPDFDRYEYMHRYLLSRDDMFNETCMKEITRINIYMTFPDDLYFPYFVALLKKVNALREIKKTKPLGIKIHFTKYKLYRLLYNLRQFTEKLSPSLMLTYLSNREEINLWQKEGEIVSLSIRDWFFIPSDRAREVFSSPNITHYRWASSVPKDCIRNVKTKTFESIDDLMEMMNKDICERRK